jgi:hypothetical protein
VVEGVEERSHREQADERAPDHDQGRRRMRPKPSAFSRRSGIQWIRVRPRKPSS